MSIEKNNLDRLRKIVSGLLFIRSGICKLGLADWTRCKIKRSETSLRLEISDEFLVYYIDKRENDRGNYFLIKRQGLERVKIGYFYPSEIYKILRSTMLSDSDFGNIIYLLEDLDLYGKENIDQLIVDIISQEKEKVRGKMLISR